MSSGCVLHYNTIVHFAVHPERAAVICCMNRAFRFHEAEHGYFQCGVPYKLSLRNRGVRRACRPFSAPPEKPLQTEAAAACRTTQKPTRVIVIGCRLEDRGFISRSKACSTVDIGQILQRAYIHSAAQAQLPGNQVAEIGPVRDPRYQRHARRQERGVYVYFLKLARYACLKCTSFQAYVQLRISSRRRRIYFAHGAFVTLICAPAVPRGPVGRTDPRSGTSSLGRPGFALEPLLGPGLSLSVILEPSPGGAVMRVV